MKEEPCYRAMPSQVAQQTLKMVNRAVKSFFRLLGERAKGRYNRPIRFPHYLPRKRPFVVIFPTGMFKVVAQGTQVRCSIGRHLKTRYDPDYLFFPIPSHIQGRQLKEVRLVPRYGGRFIDIAFVYEMNPETTSLQADRYLGIDLGLNNFAACVDSIHGAAFIIEGHGLKSFNQWWNKTHAKLQRQYTHQGHRWGRRQAQLDYYRQHVLNNFMNQAVHLIINHCLTHHIGHIVIGQLKTLKHQLNLGRETNQHFHFIPFGLFKRKLAGKCQFYGIQYHEVSEAYTSQTCSQCGRRQPANRKYRGLYVCDHCGLALNADINGAINIIYQVAPESLRIGSSGRVTRPVRHPVASFVRPSTCL